MLGSPCSLREAANEIIALALRIRWSYIQLLQLFFRPFFEQRQQPPIFGVSVAVPSETQESDDCRPKRCLCKVVRPELGSLVRPEQKCAPIAKRENRDPNALHLDSPM